MGSDAYTLSIVRINHLPGSYKVAVELCHPAHTHTHLAHTPDNCITQNVPTLMNWSLKMERKRTIRRKKSWKQSSLLTSPLANVSLGGGSLIQQHHPHGDCSIWDEVVKETTHSHKGEGEAGSTQRPRKKCWTHIQICTYTYMCIEALKQISENSRHMCCYSLKDMYRVWTQ